MKLTKNQSLFIYFQGDITEVKITKVGNKYAYYGQGVFERKINLKTFEVEELYSAIAFLTLEEAEKFKLKTAYIRECEKLFYKISKLSLEDIEIIYNILIK